MKSTHQLSLLLERGISIMSESKLIHSFPEGIKVVGILNYRDRLLLATENALYELIDDELEAVPIKYMSNIPKDLVYPPAQEGRKVCSNCNTSWLHGNICPNCNAEWGG